MARGLAGVLSGVVERYRLRCYMLACSIACRSRQISRAFYLLPFMAPFYSHIELPLAQRTEQIKAVASLQDV